MAKFKPTQPRFKSSLAEDRAERRLLLMTARLELDDRARGIIKSLVREPLDWDKLLEHGLLHGTSGLMYRHLRSVSEEVEIPGQVMEKLRSYYLMFTASGMIIEAQFKSVASRFAEAGIDAIVLKGLALVETLYRDYGLRPMSDADVLVREKDWPAIGRIMEELGFTADKPRESKRNSPKLTKYDVRAHLSYQSRNNVPIEFQFDLFTLGLGMIDIDGVWRRSVKARVAGEDLRLLGREDELLQLAVHANRHGCSRLKWLVDIAEKFHQGEHIDWDLFLDIAGKEKIRTSVYSTIRHIENLFGETLLPAKVAESLKPKCVQRYLWRAVWPEKQLKDFRGRHEDAICFYFYRPLSGWNLINYAMMGRPGSKLAYMLRFMFPPVRWMSYMYDETNPLILLKYYLKRTVVRRLNNS